MSDPAARVRPVDPCSTPLDPFPVSPEDVPEGAWRAVMRTLLRGSGDPMDEDVARRVVAVVIGWLAADKAAGD